MKYPVFPVQLFPHITGRIHRLIVLNGSQSCGFDIFVGKVQVRPVDPLNGVPVILNFVNLVIFPRGIIHYHNMILRRIITFNNAFIKFRRSGFQGNDLPGNVFIPESKCCGRFSET